MKIFFISILLLLSFNSIAQTNLTTAVDFTVTDINGQSHNLFNYLDEGKHVVVDFFFTTCASCIQSVPTLNQAYNDYGCNTGDVIFIAVDNGDNDQEVSQYEIDHNSQVPSVSGIDGGGNAVVSMYGISAYPTVILIAPNRSILEQDIFPVSNITSALPNANLSMSSCVVIPSSWNCVGTSCTDPGDGNGTFTSESDCFSVCGVSSTEDVIFNKKIISIKDIFGRETSEEKDQPLFYMYDDGSVKKRMILK